MRAYLVSLCAAACAAILAGACGGGGSGGGDADANTCGNGSVDPGEECDPANPDPTAESCSASCRLTCGDGVVGGDEECDTAIAPGLPGACPATPADCGDGMACTNDVLVGAACTAKCENPVVTAFIDGDGCCPTEDGTAYQDFDCPASCGNGLVELGEFCDTAIAAGQVGACPASPADCDDGQACTEDTVVEPDGPGGACRAACVWTEKLTALDGDGCCPANTTYVTDSDCTGSRLLMTSTCGNGVLNPGQGEVCDTGIAAGMPGACPTSCATPEDPCARVTLLSENTCDAVCHTQTILHPETGDMCCPAVYGGNARNDGECTSSCGTPAEECAPAATGTCDADCRIVRTGYRLIDIDIMDPHVFWDNGAGQCADLTSVANNSVIPMAMKNDTDMNGWADLTILIAMKPLDQAGASTAMDILFGECEPSADPAVTTCESDPTTARVASNASNTAAGTCLDVIASTTTASYMTPPVTPAGPCFKSDEFTAVFKLGSLAVPLQGAHLAATYAGDPADGLTSGLVRGFLSETDAMTTILPDSVTLIGGRSLYEVLAGGIPAGSCTIGGQPIGDDRDVGPDGTTMGWWFYVNFTATKVPYVDKPTASQ